MRGTKSLLKVLIHVEQTNGEGVLSIASLVNLADKETVTHPIEQVHTIFLSSLTYLLLLLQLLGLFVALVLLLQFTGEQDQP